MSKPLNYRHIRLWKHPLGLHINPRDRVRQEALRALCGDIAGCFTPISWPVKVGEKIVEIMGRDNDESPICPNCIAELRKLEAQHGETSQA